MTERAEPAPIRSRPTPVRRGRGRRAKPAPGWAQAPSSGRTLTGRSRTFSTSGCDRRDAGQEVRENARAMHALMSHEIPAAARSARSVYPGPPRRLPTDCRTLHGGAAWLSPRFGHLGGTPAGPRSVLRRAVWGEKVVPAVAPFSGLREQVRVAGFCSPWDFQCVALLARPYQRRKQARRVDGKSSAMRSAAFAGEADPICTAAASVCQDHHGERAMMPNLLLFWLL